MEVNEHLISGPPAPAPSLIDRSWRTINKVSCVIYIADSKRLLLLDLQAWQEARLTRRSSQVKSKC